MTYRPIGITPLRNYGWELSSPPLARAPSRQFERRWKKAREVDTSYGARARFYTADPEQSKRADSPGWWCARGESPRAHFAPATGELRATSAIATNHL